MISNCGILCVVVQSTDKNFMVPVGGAIAISTNAAFLHAMSANYPGRASIAPILDLFITLLSMGEIGYKSLLEERRRLLPIFKQRLEDMCVRYPLQLISSPNNTISYAISIDNIPQTSKPYSFLGSMLFQRNVSGCRVVALTGKSSSIAGATFQNWGSHIQEYPHNYFTAACAIGMSVADIELFISRLDKVLSKYIRSNVESPTAASVKSADTNSGTVAVESVVEAGSERSAEEVKHSP